MATKHSNRQALVEELRAWKKTQDGLRFPLCVSPNGQWVKKVNGKIWSFGSLSDRAAALEEWLRTKDSILAGHGKPPTDGSGQLTIRVACDKFINAMTLRLEGGTLSRGSWDEYDRNNKKLIAFFGKGRLVSTIRPGDWSEYRQWLQKSRARRGLTNVIVQAHTLFKWLYQNEEIDQPMRFGTAFVCPKAAQLRRQKASEEESTRAFTRDETLSILEGSVEIGSTAPRRMREALSTGWRAMTLLGVNGGLGLADIADVRFRHLDMESGILNHPRVKNGATRIVSLWPETVEAIQDYLPNRKPPRRPDLDQTVFLNGAGNRWVEPGDAGTARNSRGSKSFARLLNRLDIDMTDVSFYGLRRTYRSAVDEHHDKHAIRLTMGHLGADIGEDVYVQFVRCGRLAEVAEVARQWLFGANGAQHEDNFCTIIDCLE